MSDTGARQISDSDYYRKMKNSLAALFTIHLSESKYMGSDQLHFSGTVGGSASKPCDDFSRCPVCYAPFDMMSTVHSGRYLLLYKLHVCRTCYDRYREGWPKDAEAGMTRYLRAQNRELPERNSNGRLPRGI
jgi:hypothetical protein